MIPSIFLVILLAFIIIGLLFVMSVLSRYENLKWLYFVIGIQVILFAIFLIALFKFSTFIFLLMIMYSVLVILLGSYKYYDLKIHDLVITKHNTEQEIKILYIADLQFDRKKNSFNEKAFENLVNKINNTEYDLLLMGGDYINYHNHMENFKNNLEKIKPQGKILSVLGNHDHLWNVEMKEMMSSIGIKNLENEYEKINIKGTDVLIIGLEDLWTGTPTYPKILKEDENLTKIVLIHNPDSIEIIKNEKFDIALAGHYHRGQINFIPKLYLARIISKYVFGMYEINGNKMYVTSGVGGTFLRGHISACARWNAPPEIVRLKIKNRRI